MSGARLLLAALRFAEAIADPGPALRLAQRGVAGFCVFGGDAGLAGLLARLQAAAPHRLLFAADLEQGAGQQIAGLSVHPPAAALDAEAAGAAGIRTAIEARAAGLTMTFAPVCDVVSDPRNPIVQARAFADPAAAAPAFVRGARRFGLRTCAKHFPGHGAATADSHDALPVVGADERIWRARDIPPFAACIAAGVDAVMTAHVACPALTGEPELPATLSRRVITGMLRDELGFDGLVVTDALLMAGVTRGRSEVEAAHLALAAGCDLLLCPRDTHAVLAALKGVANEAALARVAAASEPLPDPLERAAAGSISGTDGLRVGEGSHPLRICDLHGRGQALAASLGLAFERIAPDGTVLERGEGTGLAQPVLLVARRDRACSGGLEPPPGLLKQATSAFAVVVLGPRLLLDRLAPARWLHAPGEDPATARAVARALRGGER